MLLVLPGSCFTAVFIYMVFPSSYTVLETKRVVGFMNGDLQFVLEGKVHLRSVSIIKETYVHFYHSHCINERRIVAFL